MQRMGAVEMTMVAYLMVSAKATVLVLPPEVLIIAMDYPNHITDYKKGKRLTYEDYVQLSFS